MSDNYVMLFEVFFSRFNNIHTVTFEQVDLLRHNLTTKSTKFGSMRTSSSIFIIFDWAGRINRRGVHDFSALFKKLL